MDGFIPNKISCVNKNEACAGSGWSAVPRLGEHLCGWVPRVHPASAGMSTVCSGSARGGPRTEKKKQKKKGGVPTSNPKMDDIYL